MKDILVLTKENCPMCKRLKKELDRNNIIYHTLDAENDIDGMAYVHFYGLSGSILPRVIINEKLMPVHDNIEDTLSDVLREIRGPIYMGSDKIESY